MIKIFLKLFLIYNLLPLNKEGRNVLHNNEKYINIFKKNFFNFRYFSNLSFKENLDIYVGQVFLGNIFFFQTIYLLNNFFDKLVLNKNINFEKTVEFS